MIGGGKYWIGQNSSTVALRTSNSRGGRYKAVKWQWNKNTIKNVILNDAEAFIFLINFLVKKLECVCSVYTNKTKNAISTIYMLY